MIRALGILSLLLLTSLGAAGCQGAPAVRTVEGTMLKVSVDVSGEGDAQVATLECPSGEAAGFLQETGPDACDAVMRNVETLTTVPATDQACTMTYGGPETSTVTGSIQGKQVQRTFDRTDGCGISEWDNLTELLGEPASTNFVGSNP